MKNIDAIWIPPEHHPELYKRAQVRMWELNLKQRELLSIIDAVNALMEDNLIQKRDLFKAFPTLDLGINEES